jgi:hypothetical protein
MTTCPWAVARVSRSPVVGCWQVDHDDVAVTGVAHHGLQTGPVGGGAGFLVDVDPLGRDACRFQHHDLPIKILFGGRDPRVPEIHDPNVPKVKTVRQIRDALVGQLVGRF